MRRGSIPAARAANPLATSTSRNSRIRSGWSLMSSTMPTQRSPGGHTSTRGSAITLRYQSEPVPNPAVQYSSPSTIA